MTTPTTSLDLALIGNGTTSALINAVGDAVWMCVPRFDGDPIFCDLLQDPHPGDGPGQFAIELLDMVRSEQEYFVNTPILLTRLFDRDGASIEITDLMPRFRHHERVFCPMMLARQIRRTAGSPRIRIRLRPAERYGLRAAAITHGSNHIHVLARRNRLGLLAEHIDPRTGEQWGNFVQTYSMVGIIRCAIRLSMPGDEAF